MLPIFLPLGVFLMFFVPLLMMVEGVRREKPATPPCRRTSTRPSGSTGSVLLQDCEQNQQMWCGKNLMPFWAAKSPDEVTKLVHYNKENLTIPPWRYLLEGARESKCLLPCKSTKVFGALWSSFTRNSDQNDVIEIRFHHEVSITESYFPSFSLPSFFADLGGSLGLWLGVGAVQIIGYCLLCSKWVKRTFNI